MGRALIVGGGTAGRYNIEIDLGESERAVIVARLTAQVADAQANLITAQLALTEKTDERDAASAAYDAAVAAYIEMQRGEAGELTPAQQQAITDSYEAARTAYSAALFAYGQALTQKNALSFSLKFLQRSLTEAQSLPLTDSRLAWCADLTENATGVVATIEVPGESTLVLIAPGAPAVTADDGRLFARELMSPAQAFFNAAILPGWQRHVPMYRTGVLTALDQDADIASVALDTAESSAQQLNVNVPETLTGIPVDYMDCNAAAFDVGDHVVVRFQAADWTDASVIGFVTDPQVCCENSATVIYRAGLVSYITLAGATEGFMTFDVPAGYPTQHAECGECTSPVEYPRFLTNASQVFEVAEGWTGTPTLQVLGAIAPVAGANWAGNIIGMYCASTLTPSQGGEGHLTYEVSVAYDPLPGCVVLVTPNLYAFGEWLMSMVYQVDLAPDYGLYSPAMPVPIFGDEGFPGVGPPPWDCFDGRTFSIDFAMGVGVTETKWVRLTFTVAGEAVGMVYGGFSGGSYRRAVLTGASMLYGVPPATPIEP